MNEINTKLRIIAQQIECAKSLLDTIQTIPADKKLGELKRMLNTCLQATYKAVTIETPAHIANKTREEKVQTAYLGLCEILDYDTRNNKSRKPAYVVARQVIVYLLSGKGVTLRELCATLKKDRNTVAFAYQGAKDLLACKDIAFCHALQKAQTDVRLDPYLSVL